MNVLATMEQVVSRAFGRFNGFLSIIFSFERLFLKNSIVVLEHLYSRWIIDKISNCAHDFLIVTACEIFSDLLSEACPIRLGSIPTPAPTEGRCCLQRMLKSSEDREEFTD
jgi:hypothetical protein